MSGQPRDWRRGHLCDFVVELLLARVLSQVDEDSASEVLDQIRALRGHRLAGDRQLAKLAKKFVERVAARQAALRAGRTRQ